MLAWLCVVLNKLSSLLHVGFLWGQCVWKCWLELKTYIVATWVFTWWFCLILFLWKCLSPFQLCSTKAMAWLHFLNNSVHWICITKSKCIQEMTVADWVWMVLKNPRMQHEGLKWKKKKDGIWMYISILLVKENKNLFLLKKDNKKSLLLNLVTLVRNMLEMGKIAWQIAWTFAW